MKKYKEVLVRCIILMIGLTIAHLGVTLYLLANIGADPFNVMIQGIFRALEPIVKVSFFTHGNVHIVISLMIIMVLLIVDRSYVKSGTILCMLCGGPIIDMFNLVLEPVFSIAHPFWVDILVGVVACGILAFGMTIVIKSDAGTGPNDLVAVVISDKGKWKFSIIRIIVDVTFVVIGFILGGSLGVGTIICAFLVGPVAGFFMPHSERIVKRIVK